MSEHAEVETIDRIVWRTDLQAELRRSSETVRRWLKDGTLPKPDIQPSPSCMGWRLSTLRAAGINLP